MLTTQPQVCANIQSTLQLKPGLPKFVQGPVVQSIIRLTSSLVVQMLAVPVSTISNSQVFLLKKMCVAFAKAKAIHIFSAKILVQMPYLMIKVLMIC